MTLAFELNQLDRMFDAAFHGEAPARAGWIPPTDIYETSGKDVVIKMDLPDVKREAIKLTYENNALTVEGERKAPEGTGDSYQRVERGYGAFRRSFTLPTSVDPSRVEASHQDGVLTVKLPRREETRPRQIPING